MEPSGSMLIHHMALCCFTECKKDGFNRQAHNLKMSTITSDQKLCLLYFLPIEPSLFAQGETAFLAWDLGISMEQLVTA